MKCKVCGFRFTLRYPVGQVLDRGYEAGYVKCPVCGLVVCDFDEAARSERKIHEQT